MAPLNIKVVSRSNKEICNFSETYDDGQNIGHLMKHIVEYASKNKNKQSK